MVVAVVEARAFHINWHSYNNQSIRKYDKKLVHGDIYIHRCRASRSEADADEKKKKINYVPSLSSSSDRENTLDVSDLCLLTEGEREREDDRCPC